MENHQQQEAPGNRAMRRYGLSPDNATHLAAYLEAFEAAQAMPQRRRGGSLHEVAASRAAKSIAALDRVGEWRESGHVPSGFDLLRLDQEVFPDEPLGREPRTPAEKIARHFEEQPK